jgi:hypothetical protein
MRCPFCLTDYHDHPKICFEFNEPIDEVTTDEETTEGEKKQKKFLCCQVIERHCSSCDKTNITLRKFDLAALHAPATVAIASVSYKTDKPIDEQQLIYPRYENRAFSSLMIPQHVYQDYIEACLVLHDSPKASAALTRRCLQTILREKAKVTPGDLFDEIQEVIKRPEMPSYLIDSIDAIRKIGNIAAHTLKSKSSGLIVDIEPREAELSIGVIEGLLDFYYILPEKQKERINNVNQKYTDTEKKFKR